MSCRLTFKEQSMIWNIIVIKQTAIYIKYINITDNKYNLLDVHGGINYGFYLF